MVAVMNTDELFASELKWHPGRKATLLTAIESKEPMFTMIVYVLDPIYLSSASFVDTRWALSTPTGGVNSGFVSTRRFEEIADGVVVETGDDLDHQRALGAV